MGGGHKEALSAHDRRRLKCLFRNAPGHSPKTWLYHRGRHVIPRLYFDLRATDMPVETRHKAKYPRKLSEYAHLYRRSIPTMKAWVRRGKVAGELPPLPLPAEFPAWDATD